MVMLNVTSRDHSVLNNKRGLAVFSLTHLHTLSHTHSLAFVCVKHRRNGFYTVQTVCAIALHLNLTLTGDCAFIDFFYITI